MSKKIKSALLMTAFSSSIILSACGNKTSETESQDQVQNSPQQITENVAIETELGGIDYSKSYAEVLDKYRDFANDYNNGIARDKYFDDPWSNMCTVAIEPNGFGYALKDLNGNGIPELILLAKEEYLDDDYYITAIYSLVGNDPKLLDSFWYRYSCCIGKDGFIYTQGSSSAWDSVYEKNKIKSDGSAIEVVEKIESDSFDEKTQQRTLDGRGNVIIKYYQSKGSDKRSEINKQKFDELCNQWPKNNKESGLEFIPLMEVQSSQKQSASETNNDANLPFEMNFDIAYTYDENMIDETTKEPLQVTHNLKKDQIGELNTILRNSGKWTRQKEEELPGTEIDKPYLIKSTKNNTILIIGVNYEDREYTHIKNMILNANGEEVDGENFIAPKELHENIKKFFEKEF